MHSWVMADKPQSLTFYPFAYALYNEYITSHCWYCLDEEKTHRRCTGCNCAVFCDKECQLAGWKDHKAECRALKQHQSKDIPDIEVRLLGRIVVRQKAILTGKDKTDPTFYQDRLSRRNVMDIWAHTDKIKNDQFAIRKFNSIYERLIRFYDSKELLPRQNIFELHCRDYINRHAISDSAYMKEIGKGLYLDLCAYDHSCRPNTIYVCNGFVATLRPLNGGVNLWDRSSTFYSYIDLLLPKQARRKLLKDTWYFQCECERCLDNGEHLLTSILCPCSQRLCPFGEQPYKHPDTQLITCPTCNSQMSQEAVMEALAAMRFIDDTLEQQTNSADTLKEMLQRYGRLLPPVNVYYCKIIQALIPLIRADDSSELLKLHLEVEECVRLCYPHNHPAIGFHLRNIGIFSKGVNQFDQAIQYLKEAVDIFNFSMGTDHSLTTSTLLLLDDAEREWNNNQIHCASLTMDPPTIDIKLLVQQVNDGGEGGGDVCASFEITLPLPLTKQEQVPISTKKANKKSNKHKKK